MDYYLAIDIGASSGRHILVSVDGGRLKTEEIYRFKNGMEEENGHLVWDADKLFSNVITGIKKCRELGKIPKSVSIDTWGVDYVLLDENLNTIKPVFAYRDYCNSKYRKITEKKIDAKRLYEISGIQMLDFNTVYMCSKEQDLGRLSKAYKLLMMPQYLSFKLTGKIYNEYTESTTSGMVDAEKFNWSDEILEKTGVDKNFPAEIVMPPYYAGNFSDGVKKAVGFDAEVILPASHDTASAVAACPLDEKTCYISSGTWSLIGIESKTPFLTEEARKKNFTNEGGLEKRFRFLKNIMGMWIFQNIKKQMPENTTYDSMMEEAEKSRYEKTFNPNSEQLNAPENMADAIRSLLGEENLDISDVLKSAYLSLAYSYKESIENIEKITGRKIEKIFIIGGGSKDKYLNRLTGDVTGRKVITGLSEATALGNALAQIMYDKGASLDEAREIIKNSFDFKSYQSEDS